MTFRYRLFRGAWRAGIELAGRPVRVLGWGHVPPGAAILAARRPSRLLDALTLVAACDRPIRCLVPHDLLHGWKGLLSRGAGMIAFEDDPAGRHRALRACSEALAAGEVLAVFAGNQAASKHHRDAAMSIAEEAWAGVLPEHDPVTLPVHNFWPADRKDEILFQIGHPVGRPLGPNDDSGAAPQEDEETAPEAAFTESPLALDPDTFEELLKDVEAALLDRLEREWAARPAWKQEVEGFRLSAIAAEQLQQLNQTRPEDLAALKHQFDACRELRRQWSLTRLRAEQGRKQFSTAQWLLIWVESVLGLPVAVWGVLNHAAIGLLLYLLGLTTDLRELRAGRWAARALVVFGCYAGQIALVSHAMGRAAAGYYAVTLPLSGIYLWRYAWVLRRRTRVLLLGARARTLERLAESRSRLFLAKLDAALAVPVKVAAATPKA